MIPDEEGHNTQADLLSGISDLDAVSHLLADLHDDLPEKVTRLRHLADLGEALGTQGTMLFGGVTTFNAWAEARSSFVHGNFAAAMLLCQSLVENLLAAFLHAGLMMEDLPPRTAFRDTLMRCQDRNLVSGQDIASQCWHMRLVHRTFRRCNHSSYTPLSQRTLRAHLAFTRTAHLEDGTGNSAKPAYVPTSHRISCRLCIRRSALARVSPLHLTQRVASRFHGLLKEK